MRRNEEDGCATEAKERKTEAEVDGQCKCGLEGNVLCRGGDACMEAIGHKHRPPK